MDGEEGLVPSLPDVLVHYACPSFLPAQSSALHRMEMGRKMLSPSPAPTLSPSPLLGPPAQPGSGAVSCPAL